jgi:hypothetical protein
MFLVTAHQMELIYAYPPECIFCSKYSQRNILTFRITLNQGFGSGSAWIRINLSCWIRIRVRIQIADPDPDPGGQKLPTKIEKSPEFSCF